MIVAARGNRRCLARVMLAFVLAGVPFLFGCPPGRRDVLVYLTPAGRR
jgi:hypothetical protein